MKYNASIKSYDPDDEDSAEFDTREQAQKWLIDQQPYHRNRGSMQINGKRVEWCDGDLVEVVPSMSVRSQADFDRLFRPVTARPTNVSTLRDKLEDGQ